MLSRASLLPALAAAIALCGIGTPPAASGAAPAAPSAPETAFDVTIDTLAPSVVPERGVVTVTGTVTNTSDEQWRVVRVYALTSTVPITSSDELADAVETDPSIQVGERITAPDSYAELDTLEPGGTATYRLSVRRSDLAIGDTPGVYWLGVHALGETDAGRDTLADGRARTFWPLVGPVAEPLDTALVLPVRSLVQHTADGAVTDAFHWATELRRSGRLGTFTELGAAAGSRPISWLVDPAVADAVAALADGNPPRSLAPTVPEDGEDGEDGSVSPDPTTDPSPDESPAAGTDDGPGQPADPAGSRVGATWLARTARAMTGSEVLALPYGDLDVSGAVGSDPTMVEEARRRSGRVIPPLEVTARPVVAPPSGYLDDTALALLPATTAVLVTDRMLEVDGPAVAELQGHRLLVASSRAVAGGPGPGPRFSLVAMRQRLLSEAALRLLDGQQAMVVAFPTTWEPTMSPRNARQFYAGLDVDWLNLTSVRQIARGPAAEAVAADYPRRQQRRELPAENFASARQLQDAGARLDALLPANDTVAGEVSDEAMAGVSYWVRDFPTTGVVDARRSVIAIEELLHQVTIDAPPSVTLSSDTGNFSATVANGLEESVLVRVLAETDPQLQITPSEPIELGPDERATVLMQAESSLLGVHQVDLVLADAEGDPIGERASFPLRAGEVSNVIWVVIGVGAVLLFGAIAVRLFRRIGAYLTRRGSGA